VVAAAAAAAVVVVVVVVAVAVAATAAAAVAAIEHASSPQTIGDRNFYLIFLQLCILQVCRTKILTLRRKIREQCNSKFC